MRFLVTGGCGFIGTRLVAHLLDRGCHSVRVLDDLSVGRHPNLASVCSTAGVELVMGEGRGSWLDDRVELVVSDVRDRRRVPRAAQGAEVMVHLAAETGVAPSVRNPRRDCEINVIGTLNALEAARHAGVRRFVFASSGAPLGACEPPIHEELAPRPVSPYGASKLAGEAYCSAYARSFGVETVVLRFGNAYGPGSSHKESVVARFIGRALRGEPLEIYGDGSQTRDFIFCDDLARAILRAAHVPGIGAEVFQIGTACETSLAELVAALVPILEKAGVPGVEIRYGEVRSGDAPRSWADTSKAERVLGWRAQVGLGEGLRQTVEWFVRRRPARVREAPREWTGRPASIC